MTDLKQELERQQAPPARQQFEELVVRQGPRLSELLPNGMGLERFTALGKVELSRNPALLECDPLSFLAALTTCATLGVEPGPLGHAYLVPFRKKGTSVKQVTFILGYTGLIALARRSGELKSIEARCVYEGDDWEWAGYGPTTKFRHRPLLNGDHGNFTLAYCYARFRSGGDHLEVSDRDGIEARAKRSPAFNAGSGPWVTDWPMMAAKTLVKMSRPYLPLSAVYERGMVFDEAPARWQDGPMEPLSPLSTDLVENGGEEAE